MPLTKNAEQTIEKLCALSIKAGIKQLCNVGSWPRPPIARRLRPGYDFNYDHFKDIKEIQDLQKYLVSDEQLLQIYFHY